MELRRAASGSVKVICRTVDSRPAVCAPALSLCPANTLNVSCFCDLSLLFSLSLFSAVFFLFGRFTPFHRMFHPAL